MTVVLPSLLATEAGGQKRFELDAETVGDALRALPVANLLFDEHGKSPDKCRLVYDPMGPYGDYRGHFSAPRPRDQDQCPLKNTAKKPRAKAPPAPS